MKLKSSHITTLDIGSSKICALVAEIDEVTKQPKILGFGLAPSRGIRKGAVIDVEKATQSINEAVSRAEETSGRTVTRCYVSISGDHIRGINTVGRISLLRDSRNGNGEVREIEQADVDQVLEHTRAIPMPMDREILHVIPQEFIIDEQSGVQNPCNLSGRRLEARVHLTTYSTTAAANITRCLHNINLEVESYVLQSLASAYSVLEKDEKELGTILLDFGSDMINVVVYHRGHVYHTGVVNYGSSSITYDLAYLLRIPLDMAEKLKKEHGFATTSQTDDVAHFNIEEFGGGQTREIPLRLIASYIEPRMEEILTEACYEARKADVPANQKLAVVLTGGGSLLKGSCELAETFFQSSARIGYPGGYLGYEEDLHDPSFAAAIGLLKYAIDEKDKQTQGERPDGPFGRLSAWIKNAVENIM